MKNLLTYGFWFSLLPEPFIRPMLILLVAIFGVMVALSIALRIIASKKKGDMYWAKGGAKFAGLFQWTGVIGLILVWLGEEQIYFFGARFWFLVLGLVFLIWLAAVLKYVLKTIPKRAAEFAERARIEKYLPKR